MSIKAQVEEVKPRFIHYLHQSHCTGVFFKIQSIVHIVRQRKVKEYEENGRTAYREWIDGLRRTDSKTAAIIDSRINRVRTGNLGDHHSVGEGVQELVIDYGAGFRVYFGEDGRELVILLGGGSKRKQQADIETAIARWKTYKETKHADRKTNKKE